MIMILVVKIYFCEVSLFNFVDEDLVAAGSRQARCIFCYCRGLTGLIQSPLTLTKRSPLALGHINPCVLKGVSVT